MIKQAEHVETEEVGPYDSGNSIGLATYYTGNLEGERRYYFALCRNNYPNMQCADFDDVFSEFLDNSVIAAVNYRYSLEGLTEIEKGSNLRGWLNTIFIRRCKDHYRRLNAYIGRSSYLKTNNRAEDPKCENDDSDHIDEFPQTKELRGGYRTRGEVEMYEERLRILDAAILALPEIQRRAIALQNQGYRGPEMREVLGIESRCGVGNILLQARRNIAGFIKEENFDKDINSAA